MSLAVKAKQLVKRYGAPVKFAAKMILENVVPGGPAVVGLVEKVLDCAHEAAKDNLDLLAGNADLKRIEGILDQLQGDLAGLVSRLSRMEDRPEMAREILDYALATDENCREALRRLETLARQSDLLLGQQRQMLHGQEEMLQLLQRAVGVCDYVDEMRSAGFSPQQLGDCLRRFERALELLARNQAGEAERLLERQSREQPASAALATALAASQAVGHRFVEAEKSLTRAVRLRPEDADLAELQRRATALSRRGDTPASSAPILMPLKEGDVLDGWALKKLVGRGGWGQVYLAEKSGKAAALKILHPELSRDPQFVKRFKREIQVLMRLDPHPHLLGIIDFGFERGFWYFTMEHVDGISLEQHLERQGSLTVAQAKTVLEQVAAGLAQAHCRGIVHRDIKPGNILLRRSDGRAVLADFGLAGLADASSTLDTSHTPLFAAPEQLRGGRADARSDVYSLAATCYYALLFRDPERRQPHRFKADLVPEELRDILARALANDADDRPADADAFLEDLQSLKVTSRPAPESKARAHLPILPTKAILELLRPAEKPDEIGRLGGFAVLQVLGAGAMGVVFKAKDPKMGRVVALKTMLPHLLGSRSCQERFLREARAATAFEDDHIVPIFHIGEDGGAPFLVMPLLEGETLDQRLGGVGRLPLNAVVRIGRDIARALEVVHNHGVIHCDVEPGNIFLEKSERADRVKILDFGLARAAGVDNRPIPGWTILGTPGYMSPEQARGQTVDARSDLFSLGCVLYQMCTGLKPFNGTDAASSLMAVQPVPPHEVNAEVSPNLSHLVMKLLERNPNDRPQSAQDVAEALSK